MRIYFCNLLFFRDIENRLNLLKDTAPQSTSISTPKLSLRTNIKRRITNIIRREKYESTRDNFEYDEESDNEMNITESVRRGKAEKTRVPESMKRSLVRVVFNTPHF